MKKIAYLFSCLFLAAVLFAVTGCSVLTASEKTSLVVWLTNGGARSTDNSSAAPSDLAKYRVTAASSENGFEKTVYADKTASTAEIADIEEGKYTVTVTALDSSDGALSEDTVTVTVQNGKTAVASVKLAAPAVVPAGTTTPVLLQTPFQDSYIFKLVSPNSYEALSNAEVTEDNKDFSTTGDVAFGTGGEVYYITDNSVCRGGLDENGRFNSATITGNYGDLVPVELGMDETSGLYVLLKKITDDGKNNSIYEYTLQKITNASTCDENDSPIEGSVAADIKDVTGFTLTITPNGYDEYFFPEPRIAVFKDYLYVIYPAGFESKDYGNGMPINWATDYTLAKYKISLNEGVYIATEIQKTSLNDLLKDRISDYDTMVKSDSLRFPDIQVNSVGVFVLMRNDNGDTTRLGNSRNEGSPYQGYFFSRGGLLKFNTNLDLVSLIGWTDYKKNIKSVDEYATKYYTIYEADNGNSQFYGPVRFMAIKPKELVIADNGYSFEYQNGDDGSISNKNRYVIYNLSKIAFGTGDIVGLQVKIRSDIGLGSDFDDAKIYDN